MLMRSLLAPLVIGLVLSLAAIFGVQWTVVRVAIDEVMEDYVADELVQDAEELFSSLTALPDGGAVLALQHFDPVFLSPSSGRYFQILVDGRVALRSASLVDLSLSFEPVAPGRSRIDKTSGPHAQELLLSATGYEREGRAITIAVAADMKPVRTEFDRLTVRYTQVSVAMFVLLVVMQIGIVRVALSPLRRVRADVSRLDRGEIVQLGDRVPAEVLPLVSEVNRLLALMSQRLQRSRESLGNLAHALKAPLTVLTHMAADEHVQRDPALARQMAEQLALLRSRIESELRRARMAGGACRARRSICPPKSNPWPRPCARCTATGTWTSNAGCSRACCSWATAKICSSSAAICSTTPASGRVRGSASRCAGSRAWF